MSRGTALNNPLRSWAGSAVKNEQTKTPPEVSPSRTTTNVRPLSRSLAHNHRTCMEVICQCKWKSTARMLVHTSKRGNVCRTGIKAATCQHKRPTPRKAAHEYARRTCRRAICQHKWPTNTQTTLKTAPSPRRGEIFVERPGNDI